MMYVVISAFQDKLTKMHYAVGSAYESDDSDRADFLLEKGFLGQETHVDHDHENEHELDERLKHLGGGYFELPNGEKIRGKNKAFARLKELEELSPSE